MRHPLVPRPAIGIAILLISGVISVAGSAVLAPTASAQTPAATPDIAPSFTMPTEGYDHDKRLVDIPMRDGVTLHTVIVVPKGARDAPMVLTRTPYNAEKRAERLASPHMAASLPLGDDALVAAGYIRVYQDVRGKHGSQGDYVTNRPLAGTALNPTKVDHATDAWDTIDWLVKNVPESNGRVGMIGSSYDGFTVAMALVDPHPALRAAVPQSPMVDGWMGDDWFHHGAFRQINLDFFTWQMTKRTDGHSIVRSGRDDFESFRRAGTAGAYARAAGLEQIPFFRKLTEHVAYDAFWQEQALDRIFANRPLTVPTMWLQGLFDQEDIYGAIRCYEVTEGRDRGNDRNFLVLGPWSHSQVRVEGRNIGAFQFAGDTARWWRYEIMLPFFEQHLRADGKPAQTPPVLIYDVGEDRWQRFETWPPACADGCAQKPRPLYLAAGGRLSFTAPASAASAATTATTSAAAADYDEYVSDPAKPVPYVPRPVRFDDRPVWRAWLVSDQRHVADRTDVLVYESEVLTAPLKVAGIPWVNLVASTSGTDSDWVVKLIDVYPEEHAPEPELGGYQLPVAMDIFRGRYRESFETPRPIEAGKPLPYRFRLPPVNHTFQPGHRLMVQVQSSWFPLYDRNPQRFVENIFFAQPGDFAKATQRVYRGDPVRGLASFVELPVDGELPPGMTGRQ